MSGERSNLMQSDHVSGYGELEGLPMSTDDLTVQTAIIRGELGRDQAATWYQQHTLS